MNSHLVTLLLINHVLTSQADCRITLKHTQIGRINRVYAAELCTIMTVNC